MSPIVYIKFVTGLHENKEGHNQLTEDTSQQDTTKVQNNKRIARNTLMLYMRQILIMLVSLYTVRVVLNVLGAEDYGIYNVVAGVVTMFSFLAGSMAVASQRYFSFDLGKGRHEQLAKTFSLTLIIYIGMAAVILLAAETLGLWFVNYKLVLPLDRVVAAKWVYQFAILSFICNVLVSPYMALIIAYEEMDIYAYISILEAGLKLGIVHLLSVGHVDRLQLYGILMFAVTFVTTSVYKMICRKKYPECRFRFYWNHHLFREMTSYIGWSMFGASVGIFKNQLINILLNQFFNPVVNAARSIAYQVNTAVNSFAQNFSTATRPQIIKDYAAGANNEMLSLLYWASKGTFFLMYIFSLPLLLEMPYVLRLWLKEPPDYTILFTRLALIDALIDSISYPLMTAAQATGKIKLYQGVVGGILLCNFPISYIALKWGAPAHSVMVIAIILTMIAFIARIFILRLLNQFFSIRFFLGKVCIPVVEVVLISAIPVWGFVHFVSSSFPRLVATIVLSVGIITLAAFKLGMSKQEQKQITETIKRRILKRLYNRE